MKKIIMLIFLSLVLSKVINAQTTIGFGWAKNSVNTTVFRKNSVVSLNNFQFVAFYDSLGFIVLAKRKLNNGNWETNTTPVKGIVKDAHNVISLMIDGEGFLHVAWTSHGAALHYYKSTAAYGLVLTPEMPMVGLKENHATYPEFYRVANGDLLFFYRDGGSGNGNLIINKYIVATKKWTRLQDVLIDGQGQRNAYWQACTDIKGGIHISWVWRESGDVATNHDLCYATSTDGGVTWHKTSGQNYQLPITEATAEVVVNIPQKSELINQTSMATDEDGKPYIASYWRPNGSLVPQYHLVYFNGVKWLTQQIASRQTPFSLSGSGTKKIPISRPQIIVSNAKGKLMAIVLYRDIERGSVASLARCSNLLKNVWTVQDITNTSLESWEPSYDTELWKTNKKLNIFIQKSGQGDGEKLDTMQPQPVYILNYKP
jgi:hypothetical protein